MNLTAARKRLFGQSPDVSEQDLGEIVLPAIPSPTGEELARVVQLLGLRPELWHAKIQFDEDIRYYARLGQTSTYEVWLLTWLPGQSTGLHDHGTVVGGFTVVAGVLRERTVQRNGDGTVSVRERHLPSGTVRSTHPGLVHEVISSTTPAVSLHAYAPALTEMTQYELRSGRLEAVEVGPAPDDVIR